MAMDGADEALLRSDENIRRLMLQLAVPQEKFIPAFNAPMLPGSIHLDFETKDADGNFSEPEGSLKSFVFTSTVSRHVTVARGARKSQVRQRPLHGVSGMAGVGKTTALIGLGHEDDVKEHFFHGVLYMSIGAEASDGHVITELWKIMSVTGATTRAEAVKSSKSLADAIDTASIWFHGKRILFLIDDIWPTPICPEGYLPVLEALLQGSPESRMAISTRSLEIAMKGGSHVDFGAREPCGSASLAIFLSYALPDTLACAHHGEAAKEILILCAGLPIALSVAGSAVALRVNSGDKFKESCEAYVQNIQYEILMHPGASFLYSAIRLSLAALAIDREKNERGLRETAAHSLTDLFVSLCVLENQQFAPVSVLARMWNVSENCADNVCVSLSSMSLGKISWQKLDGKTQRGLNVHDLHLDFIRETARKSRMEREWHRRLLHGHLPENTSVGDDIILDGINDLRGFNILEYNPREWWMDDVPNREYIRQNVSRHLRDAGLELELGATMLDLRWVTAQGTTGGVIRLRNDLDALKTAVKKKGVFDDSREPLKSISIISDSIWTMASEFQNGIRVLNQYSHVLLAGLCDSYEWIKRYLEQMRELTPKPFVKPTVVTNRTPVEDLKWHIDLNLPSQRLFTYLSTEFSTCHKFCATAANNDVVVYSLENRSRLKWMKGHDQSASVVKFSSNASKLVSGSFDHSVIIWDWHETETPFLVLNGHEGAISSLSLSGDDSQVFSGSLDGTVRVWSMITGDVLREISYGSAVECVSSSPASDLIAVGTRDGYLRCTRSDSGEQAFQYKMSENDAVSTVQFGPGGAMVLSGTSSGSATLLKTSDWEMSEPVPIPGIVTHACFHNDGASVLLGSSLGEVRYWVVGERNLSRYNLSVARSVNGLSFGKNEDDVVVGLGMGYARAWKGPKENPNLDFTRIRKNILFDFDLCTQGTRASTSTYDGMIRLWDTDTGTVLSAYSAPEGGSQRLALSADGSKIASSSCEGIISIWDPIKPPSNIEISFQAGAKSVQCLSFSPDGGRVLICLDKSVEIWKIGARADKMSQVASWEGTETSFNADGRFVIVGNTKRATIWNVSRGDLVFDSVSNGSQALTPAQAKQIIRTCGTSAFRLWPSSFHSSETDSVVPQNATKLTVDNVLHFVSNQTRPEHFKFSDDVFVSNNVGQLSIFKLCTGI